MKKAHHRRKRSSPKHVLRLPNLDHAKSAVLNSLTSPDSKLGYFHAIDEFVDWYCSEPRLAFNRTVVLRYQSACPCSAVIQVAEAKLPAS
jgi:hypothetical protein